MTASRNRILHSLLLPLLLILSAAAGHAQQNSSISGAVTDKLGAVIPGAQVTIKQESTGFTATVETNASGTYNFPGLNIGTYDLTVSAKGFETIVQTGVVVNVSQTVRSDLSLPIGTVGESVTVRADALEIQTDSNVVSTLISSEQFDDIASENRNLAALVALGLGASSLLPDNNVPDSVSSSASISFNGLRESHNIWLIDGGEADDRGGAGGIDIMPSQDAIAQIETLTSNYPPDYGISSGATISIALKSGTNKFHGELWEFNRNTVFDANYYANKQSNPVTPRSKLNYNIFGFNIGGPVMIPKVYARDKTFFFWNEEWRRFIQGSSPSQNNTISPSDIPTAGQNLTYVAPAFASSTALTVPNVSDPAYVAKLATYGLVPGGKFPNNVIPAGLFDPNAVIFLNSGIFPKANLPNGQNVSNATLPIDIRDDVVRIDHKITDKWQLLGHYLHDSVTQGESQPMLGWSGSTYSTVTSTLSNPSNSAAIKVAGTITPNLLVEASFNYDGNIINITNSANGNTPSGFSLAKYFANGSKSLPGISLGNPYGTSEKFGSAPWHNAAEDYEPKGDISYTIGKHALKFGLSYNRYTKNQKLFLDAEGDYSFGTLSGDSAIDFLLGLASGYSESQAAPIRHYVNQTPSAYIQDTWQVTPKLSLQLGLRYDALPHAWERQNQVANFNPGAYLPSLSPIWNPDGTLDSTGPGFYTPAGATQPYYLNGTQLAGVNGTPIGLVNNDYRTLQPRVGFSSHVFDNKTVLRGGIGSFYERLQGNDIYNAATSAPFANTPSANNVYFSNPHTSFVTGQTAALPFYAQGLTSLAQDYRAPGVVQYSLGFQRELSRSVVGVFQYVGNLAWHQNIERNINNYSLNTPLIYGTNQAYGAGYQYYSRADAGDPNNKSGTNPNPGQIPNANQLRVYQGYGGINQQENTTNGNYNGLQIGVRSQAYHGLTGEVDYTYSHEIDITSGDLSGVSNPYNLKYDKGSGTYDRRNIFSANYAYKLPLFNAAKGLEKSLLGGWELAGTIVDESGTTNNAITGLSLPYDTIGLGGGYTNRPNVVGKVSYPKSRTEWFNTAQFSAPLPAWAGGPNQGFGDAGRDAVIGPGRVNFTTSLYKTFAITERAKFQFRAETFNTFNHTEFNSVNNTFTGQAGSNFGQLNGAYDPRALEFGANLSF
jgi:hypothetical protein